MRSINFIFYCFILMLTSCGQGSSSVKNNDKINLKLNSILRIDITKTNVAGNYKIHETRQLFKNQINNFIKIWNETELTVKAKNIPEYILEVNLKNGEKRLFNINNKTIREQGVSFFVLQNPNQGDFFWKYSNPIIKYETIDEYQVYAPFEETFDSKTNEYKRFFKCLSENKINKEFISGNSKEVEYFTTYLGKVIINNESFDVIKEYRSIQCAITKHGQSKMIIKMKNGFKVFDMEQPEFLPIKSNDNKFIFKYKNKNCALKITTFTYDEIVFSK